MAILKDSNIDSLTTSANATVLGSINTTPEVATVSYNSNTNYTASGPIPFTNIFISNNFNVTNSNSRYTVLEAGLYFVSWHNITQNDGTTTRTYIRVNGGRWSQARGEGTPNYPMANAFVLNYMEEGDYFDMEHGAGSIYLTTQYNDFTIFKVT